MLHEGKLGIHPPGALGVGFFIHAQAECLIGRSGDGITHLLKESNTLSLLQDGRQRSVSLANKVFGNLLEAEALDRMPELLFICCNPNQLGLFTDELTRFLENLSQRGHLASVDDIRRRVPILLILPNGILSEQTLDTYEEQLNESVLMNRLPGVTPEMIAVLLDRVVRGVSLQAGGRRGSGKDTVYLLERVGAVVFAGGGSFERERIERILTTHGYPFTHAKGVPGTRVEFDKAMISIVLNVGGLIHTIEPTGALSDLRMGDLCKDPSKAKFVETVTRAVFDVGQAVGAYAEDATYEKVWGGHRDTIMAHAGHITSSLKTFRDAMAGGLNTVKLFSNEEWILTPLGRYAGNAGLTKLDALFTSLKRDVQASTARAIRFRDQQEDSGQSGSKNMKLTAQRNISIELYEVGTDHVTLVGTMLDNDHLIKLEMGIYLPDEQITRSQLSMIRVPFPVCREVEAIAESLIGLRIERGVLSKIVERVGGHCGCSHIKELATNIVYFVASYLVGRRAGVDPMSTAYAAKPPDERFALTKGLLRDSCLAYSQTTAQGLDEQIGIKRVGDEHTSPIPLGEYESSLGVLVMDRAQRGGDKVYLRARRGDTMCTWTWAEFGQTVSSIARHLIADGIRPGDRIGIVSENRPEMYLFEMAAMSIGAVSVPIFAGYLPHQIAYVLSHAKPRMLVVSGHHQLEKIERERNPWIKRYVSFTFDEQCKTWGAEDFAPLTAGGGATQEELDKRIQAVAPHDLCLVMYTSGTTGPPKGVRLSHRNLISQQKAISLVWEVTEKDVFMSYLPWHHSFGGLFERFMTLYSGCEFCLDDSRGRDMDRLIDNWRAYGPSLFFSVPRVHDMLVTRCREDAEVERTIFGGRLRFVFTAGASLPATIEVAYKQRNIPVLEGWGLTETSPCVTVTTEDGSWKSGYVGFPIPGVTVRIDDDQEILVKGPNVMGGYLDDEEATAHVIDEQGWFRTGDLGEFTEQGLRILGRKDGAFKLTTGEKVHPHRIEYVAVNESIYISQMVALGSGENYVGALVYPDMSRLREWAKTNGVEGESLLDDPAVRDLFAEEIARINPQIEVKYQRIRRAVLVSSEPSLANGELTPSGKIVRRAVIDHHKNILDTMFAPQAAPNVIEMESRQLQRTSSS